MHSTGAILTSDEHFFRVNRQHFSKKRQPRFGNRPFQPPIGSLVPFACPEMTIFSNDTGAFPGNEVLGDIQGIPGSGMRIYDPESVTRAGLGRRSEMHSTGAILTSDEPFFRVNRQHFGKKRQTSFGNRPFQPPIGSLVPFACPEMTLFSNDTGAFPGNGVLGDDPRDSVKEKPWERLRLSPVGRGAPGGQPGIVAWPAAGTIRRKMYRRRIRERVKEMNPL
jgi:hypothetical protein